MSKHSRRTLLKSFAGAGAAAFFGNLFRSDPAYAQNAAPPLRLVTLFTPHGLQPQYWRPQGTETNFNLAFPNSTLAALAPYKDKLLILDGLDFKVLYEYGQSGHEGARCTFLTGSKMNTGGGDYFPESQSLDQYLAETVGGATKYRSLELLAYQQFDGQHVYNTLSFTKTGTRVPFERDPNKVYQRLFANLVVAGATVNPAAEAELARKRSLMSFLAKDTTRLRNRLNGAERQKLDNHLSVLDTIEKRLGGLTASAGCVKPAAPTVPAIGDLANAPALLKLHMDLIAQSFACDLTRIATLHINAEAPGMPWLELNMSIHDELAHKVTTGTSPAQQAINLNMNKAQIWYTEQVAYFMSRLAAIPEGNGSVLDNTLILWGNELGDAAGHANLEVPTILAGGAAGKLKMGRYLNLRPTTSDPLAGWNGFGQKAPQATAHNRLLVTIAQAFGQNIQTFGHPDYSGNIPGLLA
ncbi:MAG: DUF1552 domain-containing protein [Myxococcaceae bacterium]